VLPPLDYRAPEPASLWLAAQSTRVWLQVARYVVPAFLQAQRGRTDERERLRGQQLLAGWALNELGVRVRIEGQEHVPATGGCLVMWNQTSHLDQFLLSLALPRTVLTLYNNEVAMVPLYGAYLARQGHFHVDRFDETQWRASIERAAQAARAGACILVSPEGTRSWDGRLLALKRGAFMLARLAEQPLVCISVRGAHECLPRGAYAVRPGEVEMRFHPPVEVRADDETLEERVAALLTG
jgi:1-acyl-sn-glycerol-3-phosphate acyltransferase